MECADTTAAPATAKNMLLIAAFIFWIAFACQAPKEGRWRGGRRSVNSGFNEALKYQARGEPWAQRVYRPMVGALANSVGKLNQTVPAAELMQ